MITQDDLQLGDVIFFHGAGDEPEHVAMYTGEINGYKYMTHSTQSVSDSSKSCLQTSLLRNYGRLGGYSVFRLQNSALAREASELLYEWARFNPPFDLNRADAWTTISKPQAHNIKNASGLQRYTEFSKIHGKQNVFRAIKFASRRNVIPHREYGGGARRGWTCIGAVIMSFQVAELSEHVTPVEQLPYEWISDKNCDHDLLKSMDASKTYLDYKNSLEDGERYEDFYLQTKLARSEKNWAPSISAWCGDVAIDDFMSDFISVIELDSRISSPGLLFDYLMQRRDCWSYLDTLSVNQRPVSPFSKEQWLSVLADNKSHADTVRELLLTRIASLADIERARYMRPVSIDKSPAMVKRQGRQQQLEQIESSMRSLTYKSFSSSLRIYPKAMTAWLLRIARNSNMTQRRHELGLFTRDIREAYKSCIARKALEDSLSSFAKSSCSI